MAMKYSLKIEINKEEKPTFLLHLFSNAHVSKIFWNLSEGKTLSKIFAKSSSHSEQIVTDLQPFPSKSSFIPVPYEDINLTDNHC